MTQNDLKKSGFHLFDMKSHKGGTNKDLYNLFLMGKDLKESSENSLLSGVFQYKNNENLFLIFYIENNPTRTAHVKLVENPDITSIKEIFTLRNPDLDIKLIDPLFCKYIPGWKKE